MIGRAWNRCELTYLWVRGSLHGVLHSSSAFGVHGSLYMYICILCVCSNTRYVKELVSEFEKKLETETNSRSRLDEGNADTKAKGHEERRQLEEDIGTHRLVSLRLALCSLCLESGNGLRILHGTLGSDQDGMRSSTSVLLHLHIPKQIELVAFLWLADGPCFV